MKLCPRLAWKPGLTPRQWSWILGSAALGLVACGLGKPCQAQTYTAVEREQAEAMLRDVADDVKKHYFDPLALGSDWDARVRATREKVDKADSINHALSHIAALLDSLNDSHTFFIPPPRPYRNDYGFQMQMMGDRCFVTRVRPGSDAEAKGLKPGEEVATVDGYAPTREDMWRMKYLFWILEPQPNLRLVVRAPTGEKRLLDVRSNFRQFPPEAIKDPTGSAMFDELRDLENQQDSRRPLYAERGNGLFGNDLLIVKLPEFALSASGADAVLEKMQRHNAVVLDLRGNPGGDEETLRSLLGGMFEGKVKIGDAVSGRSTTAIETAPHRHAFTGKLVVLIDSQSGSAAELFARVIQLEKRGLVMGDRSAGRVMAAQRYMNQTGMESRIVYGAIISEAEIRMADGQTLEHQGVIPDKIILPAAEDIASSRDPVLAAAARSLNAQLSPEEAGALFPYQWPKNEWGERTNEAERMGH